MPNLDKPGLGDYLINNGLDYVRAWPQYLLPHHALSRLVLIATRCKTRWWKQALIDAFRRRFAIDLNDAQQPDARAFPSFNAFFTRALRAETRPLAATAGSIACPVDGRVSQAGSIAGDRIFQAKGRDYSLQELLGGDADLAARFAGGNFATLYLSPRDYHRIHMPLGGRLSQTVYVPGRLFSVAPHTVNTVPRVFARNERLVAVFETEAGPMAMVLVGALFVACIETVWAGVVTPPHGYRIRHTDFANLPPVQLERGAEMGRFNMGSTVILLFGPQRMHWEAPLTAGQPVRMGEAIGRLA
ncbi:MAG: phosphatidylserine decarboxylase [Gammaproteobacteria bacterium]|nr:phosphatidylserine decarboxylase [Gammaproteobacteria bacterium]